jgi:D-beta-D-heptose 7-phosphate kinase/D-beta-D-heptose 1-phosphate adenosyltransferase
VITFDDDTPLALVEAILPDVLVKGGDYRPEEVVGRSVVEAHGGRLELIPLADGFSTTALARRVSDRHISIHPGTSTPPTPALQRTAENAEAR